MVQKRPAWVLTGVAPTAEARDAGRHRTRRADRDPAGETKSCATRWAVAGGGAHGARFDRPPARAAAGAAASRARPSTRASGVRFFPGARRARRHRRRRGGGGAGPTVKGRARSRTSTSARSQLYELAMGHDRWVAELRPCRAAAGGARRASASAATHDLSTELIAREAGVLVTDPSGGRLSRRWTCSRTAFVAYANEAIRSQVDPRCARRCARAQLPRGEMSRRRCGCRKTEGKFFGRRVLRSPSPSRPGRSTSWAASPITPARWCWRCRSPPRPGWQRSRREPEVVIEATASTPMAGVPASG